jgi:hypothetical protein
MWGVARLAAAYAAYVAAVVALVSQLVAGGAVSQNPTLGAAKTPAASGAALTLTITVDGPIGPLKLYCATTTDRVSSDQVSITAAEVVKFYEEVCSRTSPD